MADFKTIRLGEILIEEGMLSEGDLNRVLQIQKTDKRRLGEILVDQEFVTEQQIAQALANLYQLPYVNLKNINIEEKVFGVVAPEILYKYKVLPIELQDNELTVATYNPLDVTALQELQYMTGHQIHPAMASLSDIEAHLEKYSVDIKTGNVFHSTSKNVDSGANEVSIITLVDATISKAIKERVSDIHLEPMKDRLRVRFRIDGVLYEKTPIAKELERKVISRIKILSGMDVADSRRPQDGRMTPEHHKNYDVRVSTLPDVMGENMVMRLLDKSYTSYTLDSLGMEPAEIQTLKRVIKQPYGMVLLTGPTGAGKTTTLYSILNFLNSVERNIITVEDPVEYKLEGVNQTAINNLAGYTFAKAIRHILRHDPDVILIGEIRDQETAEIAIRAALTGHLVFSTLHTNSAAGAIMRLLDMGVEPFLIRSALIGAIAQRLVRRLCPDCCKEVKPSQEAKENLGRFITLPKDVVFAEPNGCDQCHKTGYSGRMAIYEMLVVNQSVKDLILSEPNDMNITEAAVKDGMSTLKHAGLEKALQKKTSLDEVLRITFTEED